MAALAGIGFIMLSDHPAPSWAVHLVYLPDCLMKPKLASFADFVIRQFG